MKKRFLMAIIALLFGLFMTSCFNDGNIVTSIEVKNADFEQALLNGTYSRSSGLVVYAVSDNGKTVITQNCVYSKVDTSELGVQEVTVTYDTKKAILTTTYKVEVVTKILDYSKFAVRDDTVQKIFNVGDKFNYDGLRVYNAGAEKTNYTVSVYYDDSDLVDKNAKLMDPGTYTVYVKYSSNTYTYDIVVFDSSFKDLKLNTFDNFWKKYKTKTSSYYQFADSVVAYETDTFEMSVGIGNRVMTPTEEIYDKTLNSCIEFKKARPIKCSATEDTMIEIISTGSEVSVKDAMKETVRYDNVYYTTIYVDKGDFKLETDNTTWIYYMNTSDIPESSYTYTNLKLDETNLIKEYGILEDFNYDNAVITATRNDGKKVTLPIDKFDVELTTSNQKVTSLSLPGKYTAKFSLKTDSEKSVSYTFDVLNVKYKKLECDVPANIKSFEYGQDFTYDGLKVYGVTPSGVKNELTDEVDYLVFLMRNGAEASLEAKGVYNVNVLYVGNEIIDTANKTATYDITYNGITYTSIEVDTSAAETTFMSGESFRSSGIKVYGVISESRSEFLNASKYNVTLTYAGNPVGNFKDAGVYVVSIEYTGGVDCVNAYTDYEVLYVDEYDSLEIDTTDVKKEFIGINPNYDNLKVKLLYGTNEFETSLYNVGYYDSTDNEVIYLTTSGEYTVKVTYNGSSTVKGAKERSYKINYFANEADVTYTEVKLTTTNVKKEFKDGETFDYTGLNVSGVTTGGEERTVAASNFTVKLMLKGTEVTAFTDYDSYTVNVYLKGKTTNVVESYTVSYLAPYATVTFGYSGYTYDAYAGNQTFQIYPTDDPSAYVKAPAGYTFCGFSHDFRDLTPGGSEFIKVYVSKPSAANKVVIACLDYNYKAINIGGTEYTIGDLVVTTAFPTMTPTGYTFVKYDLPTTAADNGNLNYYLPIYSKTATDNANASVIINSATEVKVILPLFGGTFESSTVALYNGTTRIDDVTTQTKVISGLNTTDKYTLKGSYSYRDGNMITNIAVNENKFDLTMYASMSGAISNTTVTKEEYGNCFAASIQVFIDNTPENYELSGFLITEKNTDEIVRDIEYTTGMTEIHVTNLKNNTDYNVIAYYDYNGPVTNLTYTAHNGLTYRFHFVGFVIQTHGDEYYKVKLMYEGHELYRIYVPKGGNFEMPTYIALPIEYEDYMYMGIEEVITKVDKDMAVQAILAKKPEDVNEFVVSYYNRDITGTYVLISMETVSDPEFATVPDVIPETYYSSNKAYAYVFSSWSQYSSGHIYKYYPQFDSIQLVAPVIESNTVTVYSDHFTYGTGVSYSGAVTSYVVSLTDENGKTEVISPENYRPGSRSSLTYKDAAPDTKYTINIVLKYDLFDDKGEQTLTDKYEFKTPKANESIDPGFSFTNLTHKSVDISVTDASISSVIVKSPNEEKLYNQMISLNNKKYANLSLTYQNTEYVVYPIKTVGNISTVYESVNNTFTSLPMEEPTFTSFVIKAPEKNSDVAKLTINGTNLGEYKVQVNVEYAEYEISNNIGMPTGQYFNSNSYTQTNNSETFTMIQTVFKAVSPDGEINDVYNVDIHLIRFSYTYDGVGYYADVWNVQLYNYGREYIIQWIK